MNETNEVTLTTTASTATASTNQESRKRMKRTSQEMEERDEQHGSNKGLLINNSKQTTPPISSSLMITPPMNLLSSSSSSSLLTSSTLSNMNHTNHLTILHQQQQIDTLQMTLNYEREQHVIEKKKLQNKYNNIYNQYITIQKELHDQQIVYDEQQALMQQQIQTITTSQNETLQFNRELQLQIEQMNFYYHNYRKRNKKKRSSDENDNDDDDDDEEEEDPNEMIDTELNNYQILNQRLREQINQYKQQETIYQNEIQQLKITVNNKLQELQTISNNNDTTNTDPNDKLYEEAPKTVLQELNSCRMKLYNTERQVRQLDRMVLQQKEQIITLLQEKETYIIQLDKYPIIQKELQTLYSKHSIIEAENISYQQFIQQVYHIIMNENNNNDNNNNMKTLTIPTTTTNPILTVKRGPQEIAMILRFLDNAKRSSSNTKLIESKDHELIPSKTAAATLTSQEQEEQEKVLLEHKKRQKELEMQIQSVQQSNNTIQYENQLLHREIKSYKELLNTYEQQMILLSPQTKLIKDQQQQQQKKNLFATPTTNTSSIDNINVKLDTLQIEYNSLKELYEQLQKIYDQMNLKYQTSQQECNDIQCKYDELYNKYQKLKDAITIEKEKNDTLQQQLIVAEQLSSDGSYNPNHTRVLHLSDTPLILSLKEEISVLKRQLEVSLLQQQQKIERSMSSPDDAIIAGGTKSTETTPIMISTSSSSTTIPNPEKVIQRLKEQFKEQIGIFREGVYIMTGYKIDMITPDDPNKIKSIFRLRSIFAENEDDQLLLQWPNHTTTTTTVGTTFDILQTDFAKYLMTTPSYDYISKLRNLPAFLASVQLQLFEKQTILM